MQICSGNIQILLILYLKGKFSLSVTHRNLISQISENLEFFGLPVFPEQFSVLKKIIYLRCNVTNKEKKYPSVGSLPQMPATSRAWPGWSQEPGIQSSSPTQVAGTELLKPTLPTTQHLHWYKTGERSQRKPSKLGSLTWDVGILTDISTIRIMVETKHQPLPLTGTFSSGTYNVFL